MISVGEFFLCELDCAGEASVFLEGDNETSCCMQKCVFTKTGIIKVSTDPNVPVEVSIEGLIESFLSSVSVNKIAAWEPLIRQSTHRCYSDNIGAAMGNDKCNLIPFSFIKVVECASKEFFLRCPEFYMDRTGCKEAYEYVEVCYDEDMDSFTTSTVSTTSTTSTED
jgi:hypothetical protein